MGEGELLSERFEAHRAHLRAVAYRMLGSASEAEDAVQDTWLRLSGTDTRSVENLAGWLTTVVSRICLDMLRTRKTRAEWQRDSHVPDPIVRRAEDFDPEQQALRTDSIGLALLIVLETLAPAERVAFVLHDMFAVSFEEIAAIVGRSPEAARQLASRARRRVEDAPTTPDEDPTRQREVVEAFFAAARAGDFNALVAVLAPEVVVRSEGAKSARGASGVFQGAETVARRALLFARADTTLHPVLVNGGAGVVVRMRRRGSVFAVMGFTIHAGKVIALDVLADPERLAKLDLSALDA